MAGGSRRTALVGRGRIASGAGRAADGDDGRSVLRHDPALPKAVTLDIDESVNVVHGAQQLSFWNGHYGERCFLPVHVYDTASGRPVGVLLRTGNAALKADLVIVTAADAVCTDRATRGVPVLRRYGETRYAAKSWGRSRHRVVARIEASSLGLDIRYVVTSLEAGSPERIYDTLYCARSG